MDWIIALLLVDLGFNGFLFLGSGGEGLIGAMLKVVVVVPINILIAVAVGYYALRYLRHVNRLLSMAGWISTLLLGGGVPAFNLLLGAFRQQYVSLKSSTVTSILLDLLSPKVLDIADVWTIGVFGVGVAAAFFAGYKAYYAKHPYPGYSEICDRVHDANASIDAQVLQYMADLNHIRDDARHRIDVHRAKSVSDSGLVEVIVEDMREEMNAYERACELVVAEHRRTQRRFTHAVDQGLGDNLVDSAPPAPEIQVRTSAELDISPIDGGIVVRAQSLRDRACILADNCRDEISFEISELLSDSPTFFDQIDRGLRRRKFGVVELGADDLDGGGEMSEPVDA